VRKPDQLRRVLLRAVPALAADPDRLAIFADAGEIAARHGATLSFEQRYRLTVVVQDFAGDVAAIFVPLLAWIAEAQPDLLAKPDGKAFGYEAEILDAERSDVEVTLDLTERVAVTRTGGGGYEVRYLDLPEADRDRFDGVDANLWQLFLRDQLVAQTTDPAFVPPAS